eukprot:gene19057-25659_t
MADGTAHLVVPWPLNDEELRGVVNSVDKKYRVIHLANATQNPMPPLLTSPGHNADTG